MEIWHDFIQCVHNLHSRKSCSAYVQNCNKVSSVPNITSCDYIRLCMCCCSWLTEVILIIASWTSRWGSLMDSIFLTFQPFWVPHHTIYVTDVISEVSLVRRQSPAFIIHNSNVRHNNKLLMHKLPPTNISKTNLHGAATVSHHSYRGPLVNVQLAEFQGLSFTAPGLHYGAHLVYIHNTECLWVHIVHHWRQAVHQGSSILQHCFPHVVHLII